MTNLKLEYTIKENKEEKFLFSNYYNYAFKKQSGFFVRWGKSQDDNPQFSPFGPEILDLEISTICNGPLGVSCSHCYKSNFNIGKNMSFETFKTIFHKIPKTLTQIAFGIGDIDANADFFKMIEYCRNNDYNQVAPNLTINGARLTDKIVDELCKYCGAIAVSRYSNKNVCYNAVKMLLDKGMKQINIHHLIAKETLKRCKETIDDIRCDFRLKDLNALVLLLLKPKGLRNVYNSVSYEEFKDLVEYAFNSNVSIGFDSCSAPFFLKAIKELKNNTTEYDNIAECCESGLFSSYINVDGYYWHCSFTEDNPNWRGIDVINCKDFVKDVWYHPELLRFRKVLIEQQHNIASDLRTCPVFPQIYGETKF